MITVALFELYPLLGLALAFFVDGNESDFGDLGKLMLAGFALAVCAALAFTFVRFKLRDRNPESKAELISITSIRKGK